MELSAVVISFVYAGVNPEFFYSKFISSMTQHTLVINIKN